MAPPSERDLLAAVYDPVKFATVLCGAPLWPHQAEVARSRARYRMICAGRQVGKSRLLAVLSLQAAFAKAGAVVLVVSAGEPAAQRVLADVAAIAGGGLLAPSLTDDNKSQVVLSNGSVILSVPASQKQIRGWAIDLLIMDEAGFIEQPIWRAAEPVIIARPGSRVILCSSPWGAADHFFRLLWRRGMDSPDEMYESWHWPSDTSPLVDRKLLEEIRGRESEAYFRREYLAEWDDDAGLFLTEEEISSAVAGYDLVSPQRVAGRSPWDRWSESRDRCFTAAAGVDWAFSQDAQALVLLSALDDGGLNPGRDLRYYVPWLQWAYRTRYADWVTTCADAGNGYGIRVWASECNGVGAHPTEALADEVQRRGLGGAVAAVWTDGRRKQSGFGKIKMMLQRDLLVLPREPELLKQLRALEWEQLQGGMVRIAVPERAGHDDLAMALMQAASCIRPALRMEDEVPERPGLPYTETPSGIRVPAEPRPVSWHNMSYTAPSGREQRPESAW